MFLYLFLLSPDRLNKPKPPRKPSKPNSKTSNLPYKTSKKLVPSTNCPPRTSSVPDLKSERQSRKWSRRVNGPLLVTTRSSEVSRLMNFVVESETSTFLFEEGLVVRRKMKVEKKRDFPCSFTNHQPKRSFLLSSLSLFFNLFLSDLSAI